MIYRQLVIYYILYSLNIFYFQYIISLKFSLLNLNNTYISTEESKDIRSKLEQIIGRFKYVKARGLEYKKKLLSCEMETLEQKTLSILCVSCKKRLKKILKVHIYLLELKVKYEELAYKLKLHKDILESKDGDRFKEENLSSDNKPGENIVSQLQDSHISSSSPLSDIPLNNDKHFIKNKVNFISEINNLGKSIKSILRPVKERSLNQIKKRHEQMKLKQRNNDLSNIPSSIITNNKLTMKSFKNIVSSGISNSTYIDVDNKDENPSKDTSSCLNNIKLKKSIKKKGMSKNDVSKIIDIILNK
ncbi:hypothetical protein ACR3K2_28370 [Cryptosporidium serpentis]